MVRLYCLHYEGHKQLCPRCRALIDYAHQRLDHCPSGNGKGSCRRCPIHCYRPDMRSLMRQVMRYSGPRMLLRHPMQAVKHKLASMGVDYAQYEKGRREQKKAEAREKAAKARAKKEHK